MRQPKLNRVRLSRTGAQLTTDIGSASLITTALQADLYRNYVRKMQERKH